LGRGGLGSYRVDSGYSKPDPNPFWWSTSISLELNKGLTRTKKFWSGSGLTRRVETQLPPLSHIAFIKRMSQPNIIIEVSM